MADDTDEARPDGGFELEEWDGGPSGDDRHEFDFDVPVDSISTAADYYEMFRAASNEVRLPLLRALQTHDRLSPSELADVLGKDGNNLHHHLRKLKVTALVRNRREPRCGTDQPYSYYTLTSLGEIALTDNIVDGIHKLAVQEHQRSAVRTRS